MYDKGQIQGWEDFFSGGLGWWVREVLIKYYMKKYYKSAKDRIQIIINSLQ